MGVETVTIVDGAKKKHGAKLYTIGESKADRAPLRLKDMLKKYGVEPCPQPEKPKAWEEESAGDVLTSLRGREATVKLAGYLETPTTGRVGTRMYQGRLVDPSGKYSPMLVRGTTGNPGLYQRYYDQETMIADASNSISELVVSSKPKFRMPRKVRRTQKAQMETFVREQNAALQRFTCMEGGLARYMHEAMSGVHIGFSLSEPKFQLVNGVWVWSGAEPRIQSTVYRWHTQNDNLFACDFRMTGTDDTVRTDTAYTLPFAARRAIDRRLILHRLGGYGLDWEGDPPTRSSLHWVDFKRLMSQLAPAGIEVYGTGFTSIRVDPAFMSSIDKHGEDIPDLEEAWEIFNDLRAVDTPVYQLPPGVMLDHQSPSGTPPDFLSWLQYCDQMIAYPFSNEGNLQGMQNAVGSYAQSEVKERRFLRSAPKYQRYFTEPINEQIIKPLVDDQIDGPPVLEYPYLELTSAHQSENSQWVDQVLKAMGPNATLNAWPEELQNMFFEKMGIGHVGDIEVIDDIVQPGSDDVG